MQFSFRTFYLKLKKYNGVISSGILLIIMFLLAFCTFTSQDFNNFFGFISLILQAFPLLLLIISTILLILMLISLKKGSWITKLLFSFSFILSLLILFIPALLTKKYLNAEKESSSLIKHITSTPSSSIKPETDVVYGELLDGSELKLDVWYPNDKSKKLKPAVVRVHGGGWVSGNKGDIKQWNQKLVDLGYVVFDVNYRMPPEVTGKAEVGDVKTAIGWVAENSIKYNIDINKINLMGQSAGANLVMLAGYSMGSEILPPTLDVPEVKINSIINIYGPTDMEVIYKTTDSPEYLQDVMLTYIGGSPNEYPERYKELSPITYIDENSSSTLTITGKNDRIVPSEQAILLSNRLKKYNINHELYIIPGVDHAFDMFSQNLATTFSFHKVEEFLSKNN